MAKYSDIDIMNMIGNKYGELTVIRRSPKVFPRYGVHMLCECSCGATKEVATLHLRNSVVKSCGCLLRDPNKESMKKAVKAHTKDRVYNGLYNSWAGMKNRCNNAHMFPEYAERNTRYQPSWESFDAFKEDMESTWFEGADLDREDNEGDYTLDNCQWLTKEAHTRKTHVDRQSAKSPRSGRR